MDILSSSIINTNTQDNHKEIKTFRNLAPRVIEVASTILSKSQIITSLGYKELNLHSKNILNITKNLRKKSDYELEININKKEFEKINRGLYEYLKNFELLKSSQILNLNGELKN